MGQNISTLKRIVANIEIIIKSLCSFVNADLVAQGRAIVIKSKEFIAAIPWFYSVSLSVAAFIYFLPEIINAMADWIRALRAAWRNLKSAWRGDDSEPSSSGSDSGTKAAKLEKRIEELETENEKLRKLLEENQDYANKHNIQPLNIFVPYTTRYVLRS